MALPALTPEQHAGNLAKAAVVRTQHDRRQPSARQD
jgi:hypothetical protein